MKQAASVVIHKPGLLQLFHIYLRSWSFVSTAQNSSSNSPLKREPENIDSTPQTSYTFPALNNLAHRQQRYLKIDHSISFYIDSSSLSAKEKLLLEALQKLGLVYQQGIQVSIETLCSLLHLCTKRRDIAAGRLISSYIVSSGLDSRVILGNHLIRLFSSCGSLAESSKAFSRISEPDSHSWAAIISAHVKCEHYEKALSLYTKLLQSKTKPNDYIFVSILKATASTKSLDLGRQIHSTISEMGFDSNLYVLSGLVDMYAKCGRIDEARHLFERAPAKDVVSWNVMIAGYAQYGHSKEALDLFNKMQQRGVRPSHITYLNTMKACGSATDTESGKLIHAEIVKDGLESDVVIGSALVDMYVKCSNLDAARKVFDKIVGRDIVAWGTIIGAYVQKEQGHIALQLFETMKQEGVKPDGVTIVSLLRACVSIGAIGQGQQLHSQICNSGLESDAYVGNSLVDMYVRFGHLDKALEVFDKLPNKNLVSWNTIIGGFAHWGLGERAISLFKKMQQKGINPDSVTYVSILKACGTIAAVDEGKLVHAQMINSGVEIEINVGNALIDMYARCGVLDIAQDMFRNMAKRDIISWNVMIRGYAQHGFGQQALHLFQEMQEEGTSPDSVTFVCLLSGCSHSNLLLEGQTLFQSMPEKFGIAPKMQHYACMVDLLSRSGNLYEAEDFIKKMPFQPAAGIWKSLLGACCIHGNLDLGKRSFTSLIELDPTDEVAYILMSNMYSAAGLWDDMAVIRKKMENACAGKLPGQSQIEFDNQLDVQVARGKQSKVCPRDKEVYGKLSSLIGTIRDKLSHEESSQ